MPHGRVGPASSSNRMGFIRRGRLPAETSRRKLKAIAAALKTCDDVILATDCDREGQLIGQEILDHLGYRGRVLRALFTAQDPKSLQQSVRPAETECGDAFAL